jgi:hypothetical protein
MLCSHVSVHVCVCRVEAYYDERQAAGTSPFVSQAGQTKSPTSAAAAAAAAAAALAVRQQPWTLSGKRANKQSKAVESFVGIWGPGSHFGLNTLVRVLHCFVQQHIIP